MCQRDKGFDFERTRLVVPRQRAVALVTLVSRLDWKRWKWLVGVHCLRYSGCSDRAFGNYLPISILFNYQRILSCIGLRR